MPSLDPYYRNSNYAGAVRAIKECRKKLGTDLNLSNLNLRSLPSSIGDLFEVETLRLENNSLRELPAEIGNLTSIVELDLRFNQMMALPPEIGNLKALMALDLYGNRMTSLPPEIGNLKALNTLDLSFNQLMSLPPEIGNLVALTTLDLRNNQLTSLPSDIGKLNALTKLNLFNNQLTSLPPEISKLANLTALYLHKNPALDFPDSVLGPTVEAVHHYDEKQRKTPARPADILNFYFSRQRAAAKGTLEPINEIKVMLVGRGGAGKTSLRRFFLSQPHNPEEKETPGIALDAFTNTCHGRGIVVRLWDFAGQEITHALHEFFLTEGCVYILVLDPRSNTEMTDAHYWLGILKRYAGKSPVVVAMNRQDDRQGGYDVDRNRLIESFPFIRDFIPTNCQTRENCDKLLAALLSAIETLPPAEPPRREVPAAWLQIEKECFELGQQSRRGDAPEVRHHLKLEEFREICSRHGEIESSQQESLARLLHRLGAVLHFVDDPRLRDTSVLNPHWVTDGVYRLLRYPDRPKSDGILSSVDLAKSLPGETEDSARFLLRLMERFEMCFPLGEEDGTPASRWMIPGALDKYQPAEIGPDWKNPEGVRLRYVYDPLPEGVLPRFIVLTHLLSEDAPRWRNGVVLREGEAKALIRRGDNQNHVVITALGPDSDRLRLLQIVQGNFDRINADIPDPKAYLEQELKGLPGSYRKVSELEAAEAAEKPVVVDAGSQSALVNPTPQLDRMSERQSRDPARVPLNTFLSYSHLDNNAKNIFLINLNVMKKKKLIAPWHDGMIDPGILWLDQIESQLNSMDLFVGLLTNHFIDSDFIERVELNAARQKLTQQGRDFLFVLILVDDVPLEGLDLAEYQILKPGGKAVTKHKSRKEGFNKAQEELENLIRSKLEAKAKEQRERPGLNRTPRPETTEDGITFID